MTWHFRSIQRTLYGSLLGANKSLGRPLALVGTRKAKTGSNRAQNTATNLGDLLGFLGFLLYFRGFFWGLIIPKWLILVPGWIAILFWTCLELPKNRPNVGPYTPYLLQKDFKQYKKIVETFYEQLLIL